MGRGGAPEGARPPAGHPAGADSTRWIGCDLDNTLCDQLGALRREVLARTGTALPFDYNAYPTPPGVERAVLDEIFRSGEVFRSVRPLPGAIAALRELRDRGYRIAIVTDRFWYPENGDDTRRWLEEHEIPADELAIIRSAEKAAFVRDSGHEFALFFEDRADIAAAVAAHVPRVVLFDRPWNREGALPGNVERMAGWPEWMRRERGARPLVIGLTGMPAAGKDFVRALLEPLGFRAYQLSDHLRGVAAQRGNPAPTRQDLQDLGAEMRALHGPFVLARETAAKIAADGADRALIVGMRSPGEVRELRERRDIDFVLVALDADPRVRFARAASRRRDGDPLTWEAFCAADARDRGNGDPASTDVQVGLTMAMADAHLDNSADSAHLEQQVDLLLMQLGLTRTAHAA